MLFALGTRTRLDISALQDRNPVYVRLSDGHIRNNYTVKIRNMQARPRAMEISFANLPGAVMWDEAGRRETAGDTIRVNVAADQVASTRVFIAAPPSDETRQTVVFTVRALDKEGGGDREESFFERPEDGS
jgi:polyferredoxin